MNTRRELERFYGAGLCDRTVAVERVATMTDNDLQANWRDLQRGTWKPTTQSPYRGVMVDDWSSLVYNEMTRRALPIS